MFLNQEITNAIPKLRLCTRVLALTNKHATKKKNSDREKKRFLKSFQGSVLKTFLIAERDSISFIKEKVGLFAAPRKAHN